MRLCIHLMVTGHYPSRVPPFGNLRIKAYLQLPEAYRSLSRPSSAISAMASTLRSCSLDLASSRQLLLPKTLESSNQQRLFVVCFFPVQFSRCVEVSTYRRSFKTIQKSFILSSQIPVSSLANFFDTLCRSCCPWQLCRYFRLPALRFRSVDLGYDPISSDHFSLERR